MKLYGCNVPYATEIVNKKTKRENACFIFDCQLKKGVTLCATPNPPLACLVQSYAKPIAELAEGADSSILPFDF
jgi:hypothetical protein